MADQITVYCFTPQVFCGYTTPCWVGEGGCMIGLLFMRYKEATKPGRQNPHPAEKREEAVRMFILGWERKYTYQRSLVLRKKSE